MNVVSLLFSYDDDDDSEFPRRPLPASIVRRAFREATLTLERSLARSMPVTVASASRVARAAPVKARFHRRPVRRRVSSVPRASSSSSRDVDEDARAGRRRDALSLGVEVDIVVTPRPGEPRDGAPRTSSGVISDFVTNSSFHEDGIKVRLSNGDIGRVRRVVALDEAAEDEEEDTEEDEEDEEENDDDRAAASEDASSSSSSSVSTKNDGVATAKRTVHVSSVTRQMDKAALKEFAMSIDGVVNARVPVRQGGHMGYMFLECVNGDAMRRVIAELDGYELSGKALGARPAKSDPIKKKGKEPKATKREKKSKAQVAEEAAEKRILDARAQMEAEALLELERFQRRRERELEAERVKLEAQRALEEERERKARILLEQRTAKAEARARRAKLAAESRAELEREARNLGDVVVDPSWRPRIVNLRDRLNALRVDVDTDTDVDIAAVAARDRAEH
jgi:uncharacterized repeat protein (TIGR03833 family)